METTDGPGDYDNLIRDKLQELREEFEDEAEKARSELEEAYKAKVGAFHGPKSFCEKRFINGHFPDGHFPDGYFPTDTSKRTLF